jgi:hypothetical protein
VELTLLQIDTICNIVCTYATSTYCVIYEKWKGELNCHHHNFSHRGRRALAGNISSGTSTTCAAAAAATAAAASVGCAGTPCRRPSPASAEDQPLGRHFATAPIPVLLLFVAVRVAAPLARTSSAGIGFGFYRSCKCCHRKAFGRFQKLLIDTKNSDFSAAAPISLNSTTADH